MNFGFPEAWWALGALAVPLIIHLLSKKKKIIIDFGSLIFLQASESASSKSLYLSDFWLLALRALLIILTGFFMSELLVSHQVERQSQIYVEDRIANNDAYQSLHEQWEQGEQGEQGENLIYFTFEPSSDQEQTNYYKSAWSLIAALNKSEDSITVYTHSLQSHFKGSELGLRKGIRWNIVPLAGASEKTPQDLSQSTLPIYLHHPEHAAVKKLVAIIESLTPSLAYQIEWPTEAEGAHLEISLVAPAVNHGVPSIHLQAGAHPLSIDHLSPTRLGISGELGKEELLHSNLPLILAGFFNKIVAKSSLHDMRTIEPQYSEEKVMVLASTEQKPIHKKWWIILLPILLLERYLSYKSVVS